MFVSVISVPKPISFLVPENTSPLWIWAIPLSLTTPPSCAEGTSDFDSSIIYGFLAGNSLALIIIQLQNKFEFLKLSQENYYLNAVPMDYPISTIIILNFGAFIFCLITMILPSIISSKTSPIKAINSEI